MYTFLSSHCQPGRWYLQFLSTFKSKSNRSLCPNVLNVCQICLFCNTADLSSVLILDIHFLDRSAHTRFILREIYIACSFKLLFRLLKQCYALRSYLFSCQWLSCSQIGLWTWAWASTCSTPCIFPWGNMWIFLWDKGFWCAISGK